MPLNNVSQARKARVLAEIAAGRCGFLAQIMAAGGNEECREIGRQADAELRARDEIIRRREWEIEMLQQQFNRLQSVNQTARIGGR